VNNPQKARKIGCVDCVCNQGPGVKQDHIKCGPLTASEHPEVPIRHEPWGICGRRKIIGASLVEEARAARCKINLQTKVG